jgi:hypothetical protein
MYMFIVPTDYVLLLRILKLKTCNPPAWEKILSLNPNPNKIHWERLSSFHQEVSSELIFFLKDTIGTLAQREKERLVRLCGAADLLSKDLPPSQFDMTEIDTVLDIMEWNAVDDETPNFEDVWTTYVIKTRQIIARDSESPNFFI